MQTKNLSLRALMAMALPCLLLTQVITAAPQLNTSSAVVPVAIESGGKAPSKQTTRKGEVAGKLSYLQVAMQFDEAPLKEVLRTFFKAIDVDYVPYFRGRNADSGMVSDSPISLEVRNISAHRALDLILTVAAVGERCTWQLRGGVVEVGTMARLARSGEQRSIVYPIKDLTLDVPYFDSTRGPENKTEREKPRDLAAQLMHHITAAIVPTAWEPPTVDDDQAKPPPSANGGEAWSNLQPYKENPRTGKMEPLQLFVIGRWAKMQYHRDDLVVTGPDFVHRALNGYPGATMPDPGRWKLPVVPPEKQPG
jgi:hypothetical protein